MIRYGFEGKVALVTGATRGIGRAIAVRLAAEGALVAVNHRLTGDPSTTLAMIEAAGGKGFPVEADMSNPQQVIAMVEETARIGGRLDYLVSNAAINPLLKWDATTLEDYDRIQETNQRGTWVVCQSASQPSRRNCSPCSLFSALSAGIRSGMPSRRTTMASTACSTT